MIVKLIPWLFCIVCVCVALFLTVRISSIKRKNKSARLLCSAIEDDKTSAYVIINKKNGIPAYISETVCSLFGIEYETADADINALSWCVDDETASEFRREYAEWDGIDDFEKRFDFFEIDTKKEHHGSVRIHALDKKYIVVKINEISDTIHREEELRREIEHVRSEEQQKSDFLSTMSHEIRTPMNGILGMITLAKNSIENKEDVLSCLDKANTLSQFLLSIINDILDLSKLESGKVILEHERFDLFECMSRLSELFRATIEGKGICFVTSCEDMDIRYVMGDSLRLMQVLTNFLSNANKYTEKGGEITVVFKQMNKADGRVHMQFRVKDTGKGMDPEFLNRIFKPFVQESSSTTRKYGGTGLGMAIADNLVRLMGGQIVVDTELGRGSEFSAYIPFDIAPGEQSLDDAVSESDMNGSVSLEGMRILMAEDNEINAEIACELFKMEGAELEIAKNGKIAVEKFEKCEDGYYDIIFMDIQMPEMDGWTAAKTIRAMDREYAKTVPIFALSANAFTEDKRHSVEIGMNGHVSKPIDFDELKKVLAKVMPAKK